MMNSGIDRNRAEMVSGRWNECDGNVGENPGDNEKLRPQTEEVVRMDDIVGLVPEKGFPYLKMGIVISVCFASAISFSSLFPYVGFMVIDIVSMTG